MSLAADVDSQFKALSDANRRRILRVIAADELTVGDIATAAGLSQQTTSHHLKVLTQAGLLADTRSGTRHLFAVRADGLQAARSFLDEFWPARLQALKAAVEQSAEAADG